MLLKDRVALITGGASGIGRQGAVTFAREGASVVLVDINESAGQAAATDIGDQAMFVKADVAKMDDVRHAVEEAEKRFGRLDIVHSNAGIYGMTGSAIDITEEDWDRVISVNLKAAWMLAHCAIPGMLDRGSGVFILTGSVHSIRGYRNYCAYQTTKGGLLSLTRSLAADFAPHVRVNCLLPGPVVTGLWDDVPEEVRQASADFSPLKRNADLEEMGNALLFLASDMSSFMTGAELVVDGGLTAIIDKYKKTR